MPIEKKSDTTNNAIVIRHLYKIFGPQPLEALELVKKGYSKETLLSETGHVLALNNVSLNVKEGNIHVVMGLSGSGKSTLIRCVNRLVEPTEGDILVNGENILKMETSRLREIRNHSLGMVFQNFGLLPHLSVMDNVAFGLEVRGIKKGIRHETAGKVLKLVGLEEWKNSKPKELSGGMQQRVGLARALALDTAILLMDEPFSGLDPLIRNELQEELLKLQNRIQKTIVFITHSMDEAIKVGDQITIIRDGHIIEEGSPQEIVLRSKDNYVNTFAKNCNALNILTAEDVMIRDVPVYEYVKGEYRATGTSDSNKLGTDMAFVVDADDKVLGVMQTGANQCSSNSGTILKTDIIKLQLGDLIRDNLELISANIYPVAVVDGGNRLLGGFTHRNILETLS